MAKTKISEFNANPALNTDIDSINIAEGCAPSGINDAIRELMSQLKDWQSGTSNDPMVIGSSGSLTLNQGTANGVAYLNGSKVVTSGSALTFNGTNFGVGVSPALARLHTSTNTATTADFTGSVRITNESYTSGTYAGVLFETADTLNSYVTGIRQGSYAGILAFGVNTGSSGTSLSEGMRLTSTGLGIGTSSPAERLHIFKSTYPIFKIESSSYNSTMGIDTGNGNLVITNASNAAMVFSTNNSEKMRLDSSGNLGLGVTPSAWDSSLFKAFEIPAGSFNAYQTSQINLTQNAYFTTAPTYWAYKNTAASSLYRQTGGIHSWHNAPSGTAGNAITFTQAMTLDASGNLLVGKTTSTGVGSQNIEVSNSSSSTVAIKGGSNEWSMLVSSSSDSLRFYEDSTERARINSSGNLVVGSTSSSFNERIASIHDSSYTFGSYRGGTGSEGHFIFVNANGAVGSIFTNGSATAYNTSSDYRLKNITGALTGYKERLMSLQPKQGTWIADGSEFRGFLAHEFANPYRASVTGEKDAVDESGNPIYQGMQASSSEVMADLVALVKEQQAIIESLKARLDAANL